MHPGLNESPQSPPTPPHPRDQAKRPYIPQSLAGPQELDGPKLVSRGKQEELRKSQYFWSVEGMSFLSSEMCPVLLGSSQPLFWDGVHSRLALDGLLPTPRIV